jgi:hypothetical protein
MRHFYVISIAALLALGALFHAHGLDLEPYRGRQPVIVVFYRTNDEPRAFSFNLALSTEWSRVEARDIHTVDVGPGRHDLDKTARMLGVETADFAVVVVGLDGDVLYRTEDPDALSEIFMRIDQERYSDHSSFSGEDP